VLKGRHADGAEADALAIKRGYDHIGLDDATAYLPTLTDEGDTVTITDDEANYTDLPVAVAATKDPKAANERLYREIIHRVTDREITIKEACEEVAKENDRSPGGLGVSFHQWRKKMREAGEDPLPRVRLPAGSVGGGRAHQARGKANGRAPRHARRRTAQPVTTIQAPPTATPPLVSGVNVVADQDELIAAATDTQTAMTEYVESMWSQLAQAEAALYSRLEWVEARRQEMRSIAEVLNLTLKA
jgi:hypothetical protein